MRVSRVIAVPAIASLALVAGCNGSKSASSSSSAASNAASTTSSAAASPSDGASASASSSTDCPTSNTRSFAKTRFVADVGLAAGSFHRYIYKPYQAGAFQKGQNGRVKALVKAGATTALDVKLLSNAQKNIKANPTLCKTLAKPMSDAMTKLKSIKTDAASGNFASIASANSLFSDIENKAKSQGDPITETTDESKAATS